MGLQRVGIHIGVVAPYLGEEHVTPDHLLTGPVEEAQDRGLFLSQLQLRTLLADEELRAGAEGVGGNLEHSILACLILPKLRSNAGEED